MNVKELVKKIITGRRFPIIHEAENALVTRFQMNYVQISSVQVGDHALTVTMNPDFKAKEEREVRLALTACNVVNCNLMQVKLYLDKENDLVISAEFFFKSEDDLPNLLLKAMQCALNGTLQFKKLYDELEAEDRRVRNISAMN